MYFSLSSYIWKVFSISYLTERMVSLVTKVLAEVDASVGLTEADLRSLCFVSTFLISLEWKKKTNYNHNWANTFLEFSVVPTFSILFQGTLWISGVQSPSHQLSLKISISYSALVTVGCLSSANANSGVVYYVPLSLILPKGSLTSMCASLALVLCL